MRAAGIPDGPGAKLLAAVAAWDWALGGGGSAQECAQFTRRILTDGTLVTQPGFVRCGTLR